MSDSFQVISINVGKPKPVTFQNKTVHTGIYKESVDDEPLFLSKLNLAGDAQGNLKLHGGVDKAVCVYPFDHYPYWEKDLNRDVHPGTFGENLTIEGLTEEQVNIGDIFGFGEAVVQVTQPRQPCFKIAGKLNRPDMVMKIQQTGFSGYYLRVLKEGVVAKTDELKRIEVHPMKVTVAFVNGILYRDKWNIQAIRRILDVDALAERSKASFEKRLQKALKHLDVSDRE